MKKTILLSNESIDGLGLSFLGLQLYQLLSIINEQGNQMIGGEELNIPSRTASTLMLLKTKGALSVTELGSLLNMSHQLIAHRIKPLKSEKYIHEISDSRDGRRTLYKLTKEGEKVVARLEKVMASAEIAYKDLFDEIGVDLFESLIKAKKALIRKPMIYRI
ncbi:MarR family winged helix-turn-helix transcriptional regulator [Flagellimonas nanhaiensis]|uniref:HTH marR-type domain-containing protein n=1 Tax=Flagellimonas nanhaiensis TaxID=2292706 RepID=A0A371JR44_9FLAO|nr:winged helix-turn-helix transcriptional regulator [Allomuricauda nanhaiensis]RDY59913.1 hypothetical protein DX873_11220 [Allomuricauda nanhaiensis]